MCAHVRFRVRALAVVFVLMWFAAPLPLAAFQQRTMSVEDVLSIRSLSDVTISPDGRWVAYVVTERDFEEDLNDTDIWIVGTDGSEPRRLTFHKGSDNSPGWSADGTWLAFRSDRGDFSQVYGIRPNGGEAWQVTDWEANVGTFAMAPDGSAIGFISSAKKSETDEELEELRGRPIVWDSAYADDWSRLWVAQLDEGRALEAEQRSPDTLFVNDFVWAPDSKGLAFGVRPSPTLRTNRYGAVYVVSEPGAEARLVTSMPGGERTVNWSDEVGLIVSGTAHEVGTFNSQLWWVPLEGGDPFSLTAGLDEHASFVGANDRALYVEARHRTGARLYRIPLRNGIANGPPEVVTDDALYYYRFSTTQDMSKVAFVAAGPADAPDVHATALDEFAPQRLTTINPQVEQFALGEQSVVSWESSADGEGIEGVLTLPVGYRPGTPVPLLLVIHGGPSGISSNTFAPTRGAYPIQVFAGMGYAVLQPNYRGSTGYGERFRGLNRGAISGTDWIDINSGVDDLVRQGIADPDRLGIMGWSFGGHHTYWGVTQTDRFAAASAGAGANDLISMYSQTDYPEFYHTYLGPKPWEDFELYEERSAYRYVERVVTPLLIQVGEKDERVPAEQSIQFFEAVRAIGKAPTKLVLYPDQPHGVRQPRLVRDLISRNVEWFLKWIPPERDLTPES